MRASFFTAGLLMFLVSFAQENPVISTVPYLEISDIILVDQNDNGTLEANESCNLVFQLNNTGGLDAKSVKVVLTLIAPEDLNIRFRKLRSVGDVNEKSGKELRFPISAGEELPEGAANFRIYVHELNGFDGRPVDYEIKTAQGSLLKREDEEISAAVFEAEHDTTRLKVVDLHYEDYNKNSILDANETSSIEFRLYNMTAEPINYIRLQIDHIAGNSTGIGYNRITNLGPLSPNHWRDFSIPIKGKKSLNNGSSQFAIRLLEESGIASNHQTIRIDTRKYTKPELRVSGVEFTGLDGESIRPNEPFNLKLFLENRTTGSVFDLRIVPKVTNTDVKLKNIGEDIRFKEIPGGKSEEINIQLIVSSKYLFPNIPVILEISEGSNTLILDTMLIASIELEKEALEISQITSDEKPEQRTQEGQDKPLKIEDEEISASAFGAENDTTRLKVVDLHYEDHNKNSTLDAYETSSIEFRLYNMTAEPINYIRLQIDHIAGNSTGIGYSRITNLGPLSPNNWRDISIPIKGRKSLKNGSSQFAVRLLEESGIHSNHQTFRINTRKYTKPELRVTGVEFTSLDGESITPNEPFNLKLFLENRSTGSAFDLKIVPKVTNKEVKLKTLGEDIRFEEIPGGTSEEINIQLIASSGYLFPNIPVMLEITEGFNNLFLDTMLIASIELSKEALEMPQIAMDRKDEEGSQENQEDDAAQIVKTIPPNLQVLDLSFKDENENQIINYKESCEISFTISNSGKGPASNIAVLVKQNNANIKGLSFQDSIALGDLGPEQKVPVTVPIRSTGIQQSDMSEFMIEVVEDNGWDAPPQSILVETQKLLEPHLIISRAEFFSESGMLKPNENFELRITLSNRGQGDASDVKVVFEKPNSPYCFLTGEGRDEFEMNKLKKGESQEFVLSLITNRRYTDSDIPIGLEVSESYRKYGLDTLCIGKMNAEAFAINKVLVQPRVDEPESRENQVSVISQLPDTQLQPVSPQSPGNQQQAQDRSPASVTDQENEVYAETRGGGDPLKNLGYEEAIRDMKIGKYFALIIGIDEYKGVWPPLKNAVRDAQTFEMLLRSKYKFDHFETLYNGMATHKNIMAKLDYLLENVTAEDNLLIFYSGHGEFRKNINRGYWVPADATTSASYNYISNSVIQDYLKAIKSKHTLLISDACFSGDIFRGETLTIPKVRTERYYMQQHAKPSRRAITSGGVEPVVDGGAEGHSIFSYYLLESLKTNEGKFFDASELYTELKVPVVNNSEQNPVFLPIKNTGDQGGQFIFIRK